MFLRMIKMTVKLNQLRIQNFKIFDDYSFHFDQPNLVVFDGPNGFGKTSFYDAIELLLIGKLRRYGDLEHLLIDRRSRVEGNHPLLNCYTDSGDLVIRAELEIQDSIYYLMRRAKRASLVDKNRVEEVDFQLYLLPEFDSDEGEHLVDDEPDFLSKVLGDYYERNFEHLHYIEQEENIHLLKEKDRKKGIGHLFNTTEFDDRVTTIKLAYDKVASLCHAAVRADLQAKDVRINEYREKLFTEEDHVTFTQAIPWKVVEWDAESIDASDEKFAQWLGEDGDLAKLEYFLSNTQDFLKDKDNKKLEKLVSNEGLLTQLLMNWKFIDKAEEFSEKLSNQQMCVGFIELSDQEPLEFIRQGKANLSPKLLKIIEADFLEPKVDVAGYSKVIEEILQHYKNESTFSQLLLGVKSSRQTFIEKFIRYENNSGSESDCPLCGYSWKDAEELKTNFDKQAKQLEELVSDSGAGLHQLLEVFSQTYLKPIKKILSNHLQQNAVDDAFVQQLHTAAKNRTVLQELVRSFDALGIQLEPYLNANPDSGTKSKSQQLKEVVLQKRQSTSAENLRSYFDTLFINVFDENPDNIQRVDKEMLKGKRKYVEWQLSAHQSQVINGMEKEYNQNLSIFNNASETKGKLKKLLDVYKKSLVEHQQRIIEDIEVLFHIYSGRISQEQQSGLGLFIETEKDKIRFVGNHSLNHDAVFTMSSGQLAALVIAFTLALNKRYSKSHLLFIDDPVQTLDELNIAGLIELLRNDFSNRQVFMSTHEDMMSAFMRYKFEKYGLKTQQVNFKEMQLMRRGFKS